MGNHLAATTDWRKALGLGAIKVRTKELRTALGSVQWAQQMALMMTILKARRLIGCSELGIVRCPIVGAPLGCVDGSTLGSSEGSADGVAEGPFEGATFGAPEGP